MAPLAAAWLFLAAAVAPPVASTAVSVTDPALPIPPAVVDDTLEVTGESIAAKERQTRLFVDVQLNGTGPYRFLVDSGADRSVIGLGVAQALGLPAAGAVRLRSISGSAEIATVRIDRLKVGNAEVENIIAPALPERFLGAHGLLGIDALGQQRLMLDFEAKRITVQEGSTPDRAIASDEIVVTARRRKGQLILTEVRVPRTKLFAVIDSGTEITMGNSALYRRVFGRRGSPKLQPITLVGVTGEPVPAQLAVLPEISVGRVTLRQVPVAFADVPPFALFGLADQPAVLLGNDVLRAFRRVSLDFRNRRVRFLMRR